MSPELLGGTVALLHARFPKQGFKDELEEKDIREAREQERSARASYRLADLLAEVLK